MPAALNKEQKRIRKSTRVEARLNPEQKRRIEHAAGLKGTSISEFIVSSADDAAVRAIEQHEVWALTGKDREAFVKALVRPPAPNRRLRTALRRYNGLVSKT